MKIAISVTEKSNDAQVDQRFGRAKWFALVNTDDDSIAFIDNQINVEAPTGAGVQAASNVVKAGGEVVITGNCGPKAFRTLSEAGVKVIVGAEGPLQDVIRKFKNGEYEFTETANVEGHW
jgi:predicted Fe-Mo cluster-binding NifX family protein